MWSASRLNYGPLAFLIYINDLPKCVSHCKVSMYADDTALYYASNSVDDIIKCINEDLTSVNNWLQCNKLSLNVKKSEFMLIGSRQRLTTVDQNMTVQINGKIVTKVDKCKHLGVIIDKNLTWNDNVEYTRKKALKGLHMLKRAKPFLPHNILKTVYNAIVLPHLEYCNIVWGNCGSTIASRLQIIQNRSARIICGVPWNTPSQEVLHKLKWVPLEDRQLLNCNVLTYKIINDIAPSYLDRLFQFNNGINYNLRRSRYNIIIPKPKTNYKKRSISYRGAIEWNRLNLEIQIAPSIYTFINRLKRKSTL